MLFLGRGMSEHNWNMRADGSSCHFLDKLATLGNCYAYTLDPYNFSDNYMNLNFTLEYFDLDKHVTEIYNEAKKLGDTFIPIGHSLGAFFAMKFLH